MGKFADRIGETNTNNCQRLKMTIIGYRTSKDIDIQFEDGTILEHRKYDKFKRGSIKNPNYNNLFKDRTGETSINNQGLKMTIIGCRKHNDLDVQFEDGTIVKHRNYGNFKTGGIKNPNYRIGETNNNNQGLKMTVIKYNGWRDIDVQFEDGTIVVERDYGGFKRGEINNPNYRIGETSINNQGLKMTIIKYRKNNDLDVQFEDGTIVEHRQYTEFNKTGSIINPNYIIGETSINKQGLKMTIIGYNNNRDMTVQFEDGTIVEHVHYACFKAGSNINPNYRIGETSINNQGLKMTIIKYRKSEDIDVQFEDGTIVEHRQYTGFKSGRINHPFPYQLPDTDIILEGVSYVYKDQVNYLYKCTKCGIQEIDTLENIIKHSKHKDYKLNKVKHILPYQLPDSDIILQKIAYIRENDVNYLYKCNKCNLEDIDTLENINNHKCK